MLEVAPSLDDPENSERPFWQPIGRFVFAFGHIENEIDRCISTLLQVDGSARDPSVASQIRNLCSRIALLEALFRLRTSEEDRRMELQRIMTELRAVIKFRNGLLHGPWGTYSAQQKAWKKPRTDPTDLTPGSFEVTLASIDEHTRRALQLREELSGLIEKVAEVTPIRMTHQPEVR